MAEPQQITLAELLPMMEAQATRMSAKNPARRVLWIAAQMLMQLAKEVTELRAKADERRIIVPPSVGAA